MASRDTALACLAHLGAHNGLDPTVAAAHRGDLPDPDTLSVSRLIEIAGDFELQAEHARVDWPGLQAIGFVDPILVLLKNTNVVVLTGAGHDGVELSIWDPLHRDSELLSVPRQEFERAWSGDVLKVTPRSSSAVLSIPNVGHTSSEASPDAPKEQLSRDARRRLPQARLGLIAVGMVVAVGGGSFLLGVPPAENFMSNAGSAGKASDKVPKATSPKLVSPAAQAADQGVASAPSPPVSPIPKVPGDNLAAAAPTLSDGPTMGEENRHAALTSEPPSNDEMSAQQPSPAAPLAVASPASGVTNVESDTTGTASAPMIPSADPSLSAVEIAVLLTRGDKSFSSGDVASARLYYGRAANAGDGQAALRLGETFDPFFLDRAHLRSARGDLAAAVSWYHRARDMGVVEADVLLNSLEAK
jgi:hypothetical protein